MPTEGNPVPPRVSAAPPVRELTSLLTSLGDALTRAAPDADLTLLFEQALQRVLATRAVRLREIPARYQARLVTPMRTADSIVLDVPTTDPRVQAVLEATREPSQPLNDDDYALLKAAAPLGGLVLEATRTRLTRRLSEMDGAAPLIGSTTAMQDLRAQIERVAVTDFTVLVEGESGTGKELVAHQLHEISRRRGGPFVAVNCAAVVETLLEAELFGIEERTATGVRGRRGKFEHAEGGTLFLDEVSDLSLSAQAKLLRAIQELAVERVGGFGARRVNTRIVAATNRPLSPLVTQGHFRSDLYYRLSGVEIHVPPLRRRREDVPELARYFLARHRHLRDLGLSVPALDALRTYEWPGNVRELERVIERAVALAPAGRIELDDLPPHVRGTYADAVGPSLAAGDSMRAWASRYACLVLDRSGRNKRRACRALNISYHTLQAYLRYAEQLAERRSVPAPGPQWAQSASMGPGAPAVTRGLRFSQPPPRTTGHRTGDTPPGTAPAST